MSDATDDQVKKLAELIANGRRSLKLNDVEKATDFLSDAAELSAQIYGENNEKTFESVMYYGMATLEMAKQDSQVLKSQRKEEEAKEEAEEGGVKEEKEDGEESDEEPEDEDEDDTMKLAWELLETARCIAAAKVEELENAPSRDDESIKSWRLQNAEVLVLLGEHGIADGKYTQAQEDLVHALDIQKAHLPPTSRLIAQTHVLTGNACSLDSRFDETVVQFEKAKEVLEARIAELSGEGDTAEADELKEMMPGVEAMIADAVSSAQQAEEVKQQIRQQFEGLTAALAQIPDSGVEANDISSLVRRPAKRQPEAAKNEEEAKKPKDD